MSQFDFWQSWGAELNDTEFANAWTALGIVWADMQLGGARGATPRLGLARIITSDPAPQELLWKFPEAPRAQELIAGTQPREWAVAWSETAGNKLIRLLVRDSPRGEPSAPWQRLLSETHPPVASVDVDGPSGTLAAPPPRVAAPAQAPPPAKNKSIFSWLRPRGASPPASRKPAPDKTAADPAPQAQPMPEAAPPPGPRPTAKSKPGLQSPPPLATREGLESSFSRNKPQARFLQQRSFVQEKGEFREATGGFVAGQPARVLVRIAAPPGSWQSLPREFPVGELPQNLDSWTLQVWLTEPEHLKEPLVRSIELPREGASTEAEFDFVPRGASPRFEGTLSAMHNGRVIQVAVLRATVHPSGSAAELVAGTPSLEMKEEDRWLPFDDEIPVRQSIGDLQNRERFDLAIVVNQPEAGKPLAVALADSHAWLSDLSQAKALAPAISELLEPVAKSAMDYADGLEGEEGLTLLIRLAQAGSLLNQYLINDQINASGNRPAVAQLEYLQVVSTRPDAVIPFEFIFDHEAPEDDATLCPNWRRGLTEGKCSATCDTTSGNHVCPMGFWGLKKVIERHALSPELARDGREMFLQSEPTTGRNELQVRGACVFGASDRVKEPGLGQLIEAIRQASGEDADHAKDWKEWAEAVKLRRPKLLIALAHNDGEKLTASLEIGGNPLKTMLLRKTHVRAEEQDPPPLVALLGCDTVGTNYDFGNHAAMFRAKGAAIVIATMATVLGAHAARVGEDLVKGLLDVDPKAPERLGELLRAVKRKALLDNQLMPLCLVAYGDAGWRLKRK